MKLRNQSLVLTGLPLVCQLTFVWILVAANANLEKAAAIEGHAKKVLASCDELRMALFANYLTLTSMRMSESKEYLPVLDQGRDRINAKVAALKRLTAQDLKARSIISQYVDSISHIQDLCDEGQKSFLQKDVNPKFMSYIDEAEFFEELAVYSKRLTGNIADINDIYTPIVNEMLPAESNRRRALRTFLTVGVIFNIAITFLLAWMFGRITVKRMDKLIFRIRDFSGGKVEKTPLGGNDELAELDTVFREMAMQREQADEVKKNIQAMVSHDIRAPLTSLLGMVQVCRDSTYGEIPQKVDTTLMRIESEINRLVRLANDLLDMERMESGSLELNKRQITGIELITQALDSVRGLADAKQIELDVSAPESVQLFCDPDRIIQVLVNLISNAVKFSSRKSKIEISATTIDESKSIRFEVTDHGKGLSDEEQNLVFEKFKQLDQDTQTKRQGSGLGLFICKSLIEAHGGKIGVNSSQGAGSIFWFEIPGVDKKEQKHQV